MVHEISKGPQPFPKKVVMEYTFNVVAGRSNSGYRSLAEAAHKMAKNFYGDEDFKVEVEVSGKPLEYYVQCVARAEIEVEGDLASTVH